MAEAFERLGGTRITTNIKAGGEEITNGFGLIDSFRIVRSTPTGRLSEVQVRLADWMFKIIQGSEVLTLSRDYFRLRKPIERRIYEIARKHCDEQDEWRISIDLLQKKTGASSHGRAFKAMVRELVDHDHLPDYSVLLDGDYVVFLNREALAQKVPESAFPRLAAKTFHDARIVAPGYDVCHLEQEWRNFWVDSGMPVLHNPDKAFVAFCSVDSLGALSLKLSIRVQADSGRPTVASDPDGQIAGLYKAMLRKLAVKIAQRTKDFSAKFPTIAISRDT